MTWERLARPHNSCRRGPQTVSQIVSSHHWVRSQVLAKNTSRECPGVMSTVCTGSSSVISVLLGVMTLRADLHSRELHVNNQHPFVWMHSASLWPYKALLPAGPGAAGGLLPGSEGRAACPRGSQHGMAGPSLRCCCSSPGPISWLRDHLALCQGQSLALLVLQDWGHLSPLFPPEASPGPSNPWGAARPLK